MLALASGAGAARLALGLLLAGVAAAAPHPPSLKLATWNLEWLIAPEIFHGLRESCIGPGERARGRERRLPCDVAMRLERSASDFAALARYARRLDADVIALQETDGERAARLVFRGYDFCFTGRRHLQNTGFAIRRGLAHRCGADLQALSLGESVRRGAELILFPGEPREIRLLAVHLKSGCGNRTLDAPQRDCAGLARQTAVLETWIDAQARAGRRFAVLGDFNRNLLRERGPARAASGRLRLMWPEIDDGEPPEADLVNAAAGQRFLNCAPQHTFRGYIDYIVLSRSLGAAMVPGSFERLVYRADESRRLALSDHCPVAVRIRLLD